MSPNWIGILSIAVVTPAIALWFYRIKQVSIPENRAAFVAVFVLGGVIGVASIALGPPDWPIRALPRSWLMFTISGRAGRCAMVGPGDENPQVEPGSGRTFAVPRGRATGSGRKTARRLDGAPPPAILSRSSGEAPRLAPDGDRTGREARLPPPSHRRSVRVPGWRNLVDAPD